MVDLAIISLLAGIGEEILFRGVLQARFGIVIASIVFGLMHSVSAAYVIVTIIMGLYIGIIFEFGESLLIPMQLHFIYDFAALVYLKYIIKKPCLPG
jgi:membrane protease YdiL (CAAX protease family)